MDSPSQGYDNRAPPPRPDSSAPPQGAQGLTKAAAGRTACNDQIVNAAMRRLGQVQGVVPQAGGKYSRKEQGKLRNTINQILVHGVNAISASSSPFPVSGNGGDTGAPVVTQPVPSAPPTASFQPQPYSYPQYAGASYDATVNYLGQVPPSFHPGMSTPGGGGGYSPCDSYIQPSQGRYPAQYHQINMITGAGADPVQVSPEDQAVAVLDEQAGHYIFNDTMTYYCTKTLRDFLPPRDDAPVVAGEVTPGDTVHFIGLHQPFSPSPTVQAEVDAALTNTKTQEAVMSENYWLLLESGARVIADYAAIFPSSKGLSRPP